MLWFGVFGVIPLIVGLFMRRKGVRRGRGLMSSPLALALAAAIAGSFAALPPPDQTQIVVLFRPGLTEQQALAAVSAVDGGILGSDPSGQLWAVEMAAGGNANELYRHGAMLVSNSLLPLGCFSWIRA